MPPMGHSSSAIMLLSAGLDSSVALMLAQNEGWRVSEAITFDYGQRAASRELAQAATIAHHFGVSHRVVTLPWFREFQSGLFSKGALPSPTAGDLDDAGFIEKSARAVWVPNRNGVFLEIAAGFAENAKASAVIVGFNREEAATFPDNSVAYMEAMNEALGYSTMNKVKIVSPTATLDKTQIVAKAKATGFPFHLLWSCYEARPRMCGSCESCMRLKRALAKNEVTIDGAFDDALLR